MQTRIIPIVNNLINKLDVRELDNESIKKVMKLGEELSKIEQDNINLQKKILSSFGIEEKGGQYNWVGHKQESLINSKIEETLNEDIYKQLKPFLNFMTEDDFITSSKANLETGQMRFLKMYLVLNQ